MGIEAWRKMFYPEPAMDAVDTEEQALRHCIRKWEGAKPDNLAMTGLKTARWGLYKVETPLPVRSELLEILPIHEEFYYGISTCALCMRHDMRCVGCQRCSLLAYHLAQTGLHPCTNGEPGSPYNIFGLTGNPEPMITALRETLDYVLKHPPCDAEGHLVTSGADPCVPASM